MDSAVRDTEVRAKNGRKVIEDSVTALNQTVIELSDSHTKLHDKVTALVNAKDTQGKTDEQLKDLRKQVADLQEELKRLQN